MKTTTRIAALGLAALALAACGNKGEPEPGRPEDELVDIRTTIGAYDANTSRAVIEEDGSGTFATGDELGLYVKIEGASAFLLENSNYTVGETSLYWEQLGETGPADFYSYYPRTATIADPATYVFDASTAENPDLLIAAPVSVAKGNTVNLAFTHTMHQLVLKLTSGVYSDAELASATVRLLGMNAAATVNITTGTVTPGEAMADDGDYAAKTGANVSFIVAPQKVTAGAYWIQIKIGDKPFVYSVPAQYIKPDGGTENLSQLGSGETLTLTLDVSHEAVTLTSGDISKWNSQNTFDGTINVAGNIDMTAMTADEVKAAIKAALDAGVTEFKLTGPFEKTGIGVDASFTSPGKNPFAGSNVVSIDFTGVTGWPDVDVDGDRNADGKGLPALAFRGLIGRTEYYPALAEVKLPAGVKVIGSYAFDRCYALTTVAMDNVEVIGADAFALCSALTIVSLARVKNIMSRAFNGTTLTEVDLPVAITIETQAFLNCQNLVKVNAPAVTLVGINAFAGTSLTEVDLPVATIIGAGAFSDCQNLVKVNAPAVTSVDIIAFANSTALTTLKLPAATIIGSRFVSGCSSLSDLQLTAAGTFMSVEAFNDFPNAAQCALTLNKDKKYGAENNVKPKATGNVMWYPITDNRGQSTQVRWKSISYTDD